MKIFKQLTDVCRWARVKIGIVSRDIYTFIPLQRKSLTNISRCVVRMLARNLWALLAILLVCISFWLSKVVSFVGTEAYHHAPTLMFWITSLKSVSNRPEVRIGGLGDHLTANFLVPMGTNPKSEIRIWGALRPDNTEYDDYGVLESPGPCTLGAVLGGGNDYRITYSREKVILGPWIHNGPYYDAVNIEALPPLKPDADDVVDISCDLNIHPGRETFADRKLEIDLVDRESELHSEGEEADGVVVSFDYLRGTSDLHLFSSSSDTSTAESERVLKRPVGHVVAEWRDTRSAQQRDVVLLLIGTFLAVAAACGIEWLRPWLDVARSKGSGVTSPAD